MEDIQDLKKRVDHLQYGEINPLKEEVNEMKITLSNNDLLTKQAIESNKRLTDSMEVLKDTMIEIGQSVKDSNKVTGQLATTVEELNNKIVSVEKHTKESIDKFGKKLDEIDDKAKIDWQIFIKNNWLGVIMGLGALVYALSQYIK